MTGDPRSRSDYRAVAGRVKAAAIAQGTPCALCNGHHGPLRDDVPPDHPLYVTADHVTPLANGGHLLGPMVAVHRICNLRRQNTTGPVDYTRPLTSAPRKGRRTGRTSRDWWG